MVKKSKIGMKLALFIFMGVIFLTIPLSAVNASGSGPGSAAAGNELFVHYKFEALNYDGEPDEVTDNLGNVHGKAHGAQSDPSGKIDRCVSFDSTSYIELSENVIVSSTFSLSLWMNIDNDSIDSGYKTIFTQKSSDEGIGNSKFLLRVNGTTNKPDLFVRGLQNNDAGKLIQVNKTLNKDIWYHVVVTFGTTEVKVYINDDLKVSEAHGTDSNFQQYINIRAIGGDPTDGYFHGKIDDFRIYNTTLTASEITTIFKLEDDVTEEEQEEEETTEEETTNQTISGNETVSFPITFNVFEIYAFLIDRLGPGGAFAFVLFNFLISFGAITMFRFYTYQTKPIIFTNKKKGYGDFRLGRLISCEEAAHPQLIGYNFFRFRDYNRYKIKSEHKGFTPYYGKLHYVEMKKKRWRLENWGLVRWEFYPHFYINVVKLPKHLQFNIPILKETLGNNVKYFFFRIFNVLPFVTLTRLLHDSLEFDPEKTETIKEINVIQLEYLMERKHFEYITEFEKKEFFEKFNVNVWVKYPEMKLRGVEVDGKEIFIRMHDAFLLEYTPLKIKLDQLILKNAIDGETVISKDAGAIMPISEKDNEMFQIRDQISELFMKYGLTEELIEIFDGILQELEEARDYQKEQIKHGIMDEKDQFSFLTLDEINNLKNDKSTYRKVRKIGDAIPKIRKIEDLDEAMKYARDLREQRELYELKLQVERARTREVELKLEHEIDKNTRLHVDMEELIEEKIARIRQLTVGKVDSKIEFTAKVMELVDYYGMDVETAMNEAIKEELDKKRTNTTEFTKLSKQFDELKKQISKLPKSKQLEILLTDENTKPVKSLSDLRNLQDTEPNNGGYADDE